MSHKEPAARITRTEKPATRSSTTTSKVESQPDLSATTEAQPALLGPQDLQRPQDVLRPHEVLRLQRSVGNRAVQHLIASRKIQAKLTVGAAHDPYEQEADRMAEQVMRMPAKPLEKISHVQRSTDEELQTQRHSLADSFDTSNDFESRVQATRGSGSPLPDTVRDFMEPRFGADFSNVRLHTNSESAQLNREVSAQAFTLGSDIYLGEGQTDVASHEGQQLLAHELTHVVQQTEPVIRRQIGMHGDGQRVRERSSGDIYFAQWNQKYYAYDLYQRGVYVVQVMPNDPDYFLVGQDDEMPDTDPASYSDPEDESSSQMSEDEGAADQTGYLSEDTDAESEKPSLSPLEKKYNAAWQSGASTLSTSKIDALLPGIKKNIAQLVKAAYGTKPKDEADEMDTEAASLLPKGDRNCAACVDVNTEEGLKRYATYNNRSVTRTSGYNAKREEGVPKMHAIGAHTKFGSLTLGNEHAELRAVDKVAVDSFKESGKSSYKAEEALSDLGYVGIFQPCCVLCAVCFAVIGKADATRGYHTKDVKLWNWPPFILADKQALTTILGAEAMKHIGDNKRNLEAVLQRVTTAHSDWKRIW